MVGVLGGEALLLCGKALRSNPTAGVEWSDNEGHLVVEAANSRASITSSQALVSLSLRELAREDTGNWTCAIAVEGVGTLLLSITLTVLGEI